MKLPPTVSMRAVDSVITAAFHSYGKHGPMTQDLVRASLILVEECGEAAAEVLKMTNPTGTGSHRGATGSPEALMWELAQVAATAMAIIDVVEEKCHQSRLCKALSGDQSRKEP